MSAEQITPVSGPFKGQTGELVFRYSDGSAEIQINGVGTAVMVERDDMPPTFDAYAWPGGYPIAYYPLDEYGSTTGGVLCPTCAAKEYADWLDDRAATLAGDFPEDAPDMSEHPKCHAEIEQGVHSTIWCDGCSQPFIFQDWCDFCRESVDADEDHPHVCKPLKWQVSYSYDRREPRYPSVKRFATREAARDFARTYRRLNYTTRVSPIVPPILPE